MWRQPALIDPLAKAALISVAVYSRFCRTTVSSATARMKRRANATQHGQAKLGTKTFVYLSGVLTEVLHTSCSCNMNNFVPGSPACLDASSPDNPNGNERRAVAPIHGFGFQMTELTLKEHLEKSRWFSANRPEVKVLVASDWCGRSNPVWVTCLRLVSWQNTSHPPNWRAWCARS